MWTFRVGYLYVTTCLLCLLLPCDGYNVLLWPGVGGSHLVYFGELAKALRHRGFDVTILTSDRFKVSSDVTDTGVRWMTFKSMVDFKEAEEVFTRIQEMVYEDGSFLSKMKPLKNMMAVLNDEEESLFKDTGVLMKIKATKFDFAIHDLFPIHFQLPYVLDIPSAHFGTTCLAAAREPYLPSYVPGVLTPYTDKMTFKERLINFMAVGMTQVLLAGRSERTQKYAPHLPPMSEMDLMNRCDICFRLRDEMVETPRPRNPNMINIGDVMHRPGRALPEDLDSIVSGAKHGVVLMSFGTFIGAAMPKELVMKFAQAFGRLQQQVIWKHSAEIENLPDNIILLPWIPQNDLLAHENVKAFVTHCGINSLLETTHHGVPVVGFPIAIDAGSCNVLQENGLGINLNILNFTVDEVHDAILKVLGDDYQKAGKRVSAISKSLPNGGDTAAFWIEHVIRFGSDHLRPYSQEMSFYQYIMLDILFVMITAVFVFVFVARMCFRCICSSKHKLKTE